MALWNFFRLLHLARIGHLFFYCIPILSLVTLPTTMINHILALGFMDSWLLPHSHL